MNHEFGQNLGVVNPEGKEFGIPVRKGRPRIEISSEILSALYHQQGLPVQEIADKLNLSTDTISRRMKEFGIPVRKGRPKKKATYS